MAANGRGGGGGRGMIVSNLDGKAPEDADFANYFCTYAFLYHQKDMLEDHKRTGAYYNSVLQNRRQFDGKVVLDVGTGSGILAIFAAKAGARKVYAVEATDMAKFAKQLVSHQKLDHVVEVIQGTIETVDIPEQVDIIISEWMGYFLLRESMLDSVLVARNKFLKPGGALYPSHARMLFAPVATDIARRRFNEFHGCMEGWAEFCEEMRQYYSVDLGCLTSAYHKEQAEYYHQTALWADIHPSQMRGPAACFKEYDLLTVTLEELKEPLKAQFTLDILDQGGVDAWCGYFDVQFRGSPENPTDMPVTLSTAPDPTGATHWGQQLFFLHPHVQAQQGDKIEVDITVTRKKENHRLMQVVTSHKVVPQGGPSDDSPPVKQYFQIE